VYQPRAYQALTTIVPIYGSFCLHDAAGLRRLFARKWKRSRVADRALDPVSAHEIRGRVSFVTSVD
jgi:hypothetical protein